MISEGYPNVDFDENLTLALIGGKSPAATS
jgi:hypothetical protein